MTVDGETVVASGELALVPGPNLLPPIAAGLAAVAGALVLGRRRQGRVATVAITVAATAAVYLGATEIAANPPEADASPLLVALPLAGFVLGVVAVLLRRGAWRVVAVIAAVAALGGWVLGRLPVLWKPVLPTDLSPVVDRSLTAAVIGLAAAAAVLAVRSGELGVALADDRPEDEEQETAVAN